MSDFYTEKLVVLYRMKIFYNCNISRQKFLKAVSISDFEDRSSGYIGKITIVFIFLSKKEAVTFAVNSSICNFLTEFC